MSTRTAPSMWRAHEAGPGENPGGVRIAFKKLGVAGFVFFLVKGLLWLLVPAAVAFLAS